MAKPIIYLTFADQRDDHLPLLKQERKEIVKILRPYKDENRIEVEYEAAADHDIVAGYLSDYSRRISVFHYAGHAGRGQLGFEDEPVMALGLAEMLATLPNLKLVFLNGCSSRTLLQTLFDKNIKSVIATRVPIRDDKATRFAIRFYKSLSEGKTLREAFEFSKAVVHAVDDSIDISIRGLDLNGSTNGHFEWGLYTSDDSILNYTLPVTSAGPDARSNPFVSQKIEVNTTLRDKLLESFSPLFSKLSEFKTLLDENKFVELRQVDSELLNVMPAPLSVPFMRILRSQTLTTERLDAFVEIYRSLMQLMSFILISQLWDYLFENKKLVLPDALKIALEVLLTTPSSKLAYADYIAVIRGIRVLLTDAGVPIFVSELHGLADAFNNEPKFIDAHKRMEELRHTLGQSTALSPEQLLNFNTKAEEDIGDILSHMTFICKYKMVAIKDIDLIKYRHSPASYRMRRAYLDNITSTLLTETQDTKSFADVQSVVLIKDEANFDKYLNLSPFIFDENSLLEKSGQARLFMFSSCNFQDGTLDFRFLEDPSGFTKVDTMAEGPLRELFGKFYTNVFRN